jgi:hypothetical protein
MKRELATSSEYDAFKGLLNRIMAVPHSEIVRREAEYQKQVALNPKRGPKPKRKRDPAQRPGYRASLALHGPS